jgi:hypothetical protein
MNREPSKGIIWECSIESGFARYEEVDAYNLEKARLEGSTDLVAVRNNQNEVDLRTMKQKNKSTGVLRDVRRLELSCSMVSQARVVD